MKNLRRVEVEWLDAAHLTGSWEDIEAVRAPQGRSLARCFSIGYVVADDKNVLILARSLHGNRVGGVQIIPQVAITKRSEVKP